MPEFNCPKCGSDQTAKCSAIFEAGTTAIQTRTKGMGVGLTGEGLVPVIGSGTTTGVQQTQLAARLAPPRKEPVASLVFAPILLAPLAGFILGFLWAIVSDTTVSDSFVPITVVTFIVLEILGILGAIVNFRFNIGEWPGLYEAWTKQWHCARCGEVFIPGGPEDVARDDG